MSKQHQSKVEKEKNDLSPYGFILELASGGLSGCSYKPFTPGCMWSFINMVTNVDNDLFFEITREDTELKIEGFCHDKQFTLFQDTYDAEIKFLGSPPIDYDNLDLLQVSEDRWGLTYFLPRSAFYSFDEMVKLGGQVLEAGNILESVSLSQKFPDLGLPLGYC